MENHQLDILFNDFMESKIGFQPRGAEVARKARALQNAIKIGADFSDEIADLEYEATKNGYYAGWMAAISLLDIISR